MKINNTEISNLVLVIHYHMMLYVYVLPSFFSFWKPLFFIVSFLGYLFFSHLDSSPKNYRIPLQI